MKSIPYVRDKNYTVSFSVEANFHKSLAEFSEHEKHHELSKAQLKEAYGLIQQAGKALGLGKAPKPEEQAE